MIDSPLILYSANVLVTSKGTLKLADLGLGRLFSNQTNEAFSKASAARAREREREREREMR